MVLSNKRNGLTRNANASIKDGGGEATLGQLSEQAKRIREKAQQAQLSDLKGERAAD